MQKKKKANYLDASFLAEGDKQFGALHIDLVKQRSVVAQRGRGGAVEHTRHSLQRSQHILLRQQQTNPEQDMTYQQTLSQLTLTNKKSKHADSHSKQESSDNRLNFKLYCDLNIVS